jgi:hypothetical protein
MAIELVHQKERMKEAKIEHSIAKMAEPLNSDLALKARISMLD